MKLLGQDCMYFLFCESYCHLALLRIVSIFIPKVILSALTKSIFFYSLNSVIKF